MLRMSVAADGSTEVNLYLLPLGADANESLRRIPSVDQNGVPFGSLLLPPDDFMQFFPHIFGQKGMSLFPKQYQTGAVCFIGKGIVVCNIAHAAQ